MAAVVEASSSAPAEARELDLGRRIREIRNRRPAVGVAVGVVQNGKFEFHGAGLADIAAGTPITVDTAFRIASLTKPFTAIAVMQLWEEGRVDLDAPANDYLRAYRLVGEPAFRPASLRDLLTHTSGIPDVIHVADLLHPDWGSFESRPAARSVSAGASMPSLAEVYRSGLRSVVAPGTTFAYTNHGFATLGQVVEDMSGIPLDRYFHDRVFGPLGMLHTHLGPGDAHGARRATGYAMGSRGPKAVPDRDWVTRGASGAVSTTRDMGRFIAALIGGGANEHGSILRPTTLATMFEPHFQSDPRVPGMGLGFFPSDAGGHRVVGHDGRLPGFNAQLLVAPEDGVGVIGFTNGSTGATSWLPIELKGLLRGLLGVPPDTLRTDIPAHPEIWAEICGRYVLPARISDLRGRILMGGGVEVLVRNGRLVARLLTPVPSLLRGVPLHPDDPLDPYVFRLDLAPYGMESVRIAFTRDALHSDLACLALTKATNASPARLVTMGRRFMAGRHWHARARRRRLMAADVR